MKPGRAPQSPLRTLFAVVPGQVEAEPAEQEIGDFSHVERELKADEYARNSEYKEFRI